ncbi:hypothetical protein C2845_PM03G00800 [Panicum miliaceum]|uniref:Uncharacterized protein n=1 Tax=Panicum miliaceum TaxID=4540 RepID=A0A3L6TCL0_PANMI|nr:hypothetical protein C2845_PM03G00800 [Panicum miliaceum]
MAAISMMISVSFNISLASATSPIPKFFNETLISCHKARKQRCTGSITQRTQNRPCEIFAESSAEKKATSERTRSLQKPSLVAGAHQEQPEERLCNCYPVGRRLHPVSAAAYGKPPTIPRHLYPSTPPALLMGASESLFSRQQPRPQWVDEITTVSEGRRDDADADPLVRRMPASDPSP